jgi:hypothetical protein
MVRSLDRSSTTITSRRPEAVAFLESFLVNLFKGFVVILHALVEGGQVWLPGSVDRAGFGVHLRIPWGEAERKEV